MAKNLKKGSKVSFNYGNGRRIKGVVTKKYTARKGSLNVPNNKRTIVHVFASKQLFLKSPKELRRIR